MEESVLLGTKPLVDSIRHFIRDPSGVFSVCHLCECGIVQWRRDSHLLPYSIFSLHIIKRTLITRWLGDMNFMFEWQEQYLTSERSSNIKFISSRHRVILYLFYFFITLSPEGFIERYICLSDLLRLGVPREGLIILYHKSVAKHIKHTERNVVYCLSHGWCFLAIKRVL